MDEKLDIQALANQLRALGYWHIELTLGDDGGHDATCLTREGYLKVSAAIIGRGRDMEYGRVHTDGSRSGGQKPIDVVTRLVKLLEWGECQTCGTICGPSNCTDCDCERPTWTPIKSETYARAAIAAMLEAVGEPEGWKYTKEGEVGVGGWTPLYSLSALLAAVEKD